MSSFNKMGVNPVPQPAEPRQKRTPKPRLMVKPPGPVWMLLTKETQDAITQRAKESAQALEAAQAQEAACSTRTATAATKGAVRQQHAPTLQTVVGGRGSRGGAATAHGLEMSSRSSDGGHPADILPVAPAGNGITTNG